jgi:hypothetical protein
VIMEESNSCGKHRLFPILRVQIQTQKPEIGDGYTMNYGPTIISWNHDKRNIYTEQK